MEANGCDLVAMLVEGDPDFSAIVTLSLQLDPGIALIAVSSGRAALDRLKRAPAPSLILIDSHLPDMDVVALARAIQANHKGVIQDITESHRFERHLLAAARTDELTGIPSGRAFNLELDKLLQQASSAAEHPFALPIVDLDRFKEVNDRLGHAAGDEVLPSGNVNKGAHRRIPLERQTKSLR